MKGSRPVVEIVRGDPSNPKGLPRPLAPDPEGKRRPVPYTNGELWGVLDEDRTFECRDEAGCLVCGLLVAVGKAFVSRAGHARADIPVVLDLETIEGRALDGAPLHNRCALLTEAHCKTVRDQLREGTMYVVAYDESGSGH